MDPVNRSDRYLTQIAIGPPDFTLLKEREAIKHVFDSEERKVRIPHAMYTFDRYNES